MDQKRIKFDGPEAQGREPVEIEATLIGLMLSTQLQWLLKEPTPGSECIPETPTAVIIVWLEGLLVVGQWKLQTTRTILGKRHAWVYLGGDAMGWDGSVSETPLTVEHELALQLIWGTVNDLLKKERKGGIPKTIDHSWWQTQTSLLAKIMSYLIKWVEVNPDTTIDQKLMHRLLLEAKDHKCECESCVAARKVCPCDGCQQLRKLN